MDALIERFRGAVADGDLMICEQWGVAYQKDMSNPVPYDDAYFDKYVGYEHTEIANAINAGRIALVNRHLGPKASVLDIGIGSGEFIKNRPNTFGYDINPKAVAWLKKRMRWSDKFCVFEGFTFWDVLEHVPTPADYFAKMPDDAFVFVSIPIFADLKRIRESKHYRPSEHLYYFTEQGFIDWMALHRFYPHERTDFETKAGRDNILSFAFRRAA